VTESKADNFVTEGSCGIVMQLTCALRFVERDGKRILQQAWQGPDYAKQRMHVEWRDVPFEENPSEHE